jgi:hypothetical protein
VQSLLTHGQLGGVGAGQGLQTMHGGLPVGGFVAERRVPCSCCCCCAGFLQPRVGLLCAGVTQLHAACLPGGLSSGSTQGGRAVLLAHAVQWAGTRHTQLLSPGEGRGPGWWEVAVCLSLGESWRLLWFACHTQEVSQAVGSSGAVKEVGAVLGLTNLQPWSPPVWVCWLGLGTLSLGLSADG